MADRAPAREQNERDIPHRDRGQSHSAPSHLRHPRKQISDVINSATAAPDPRFREIYQQETPGLLRFFRRHLASAEEATDLAQETMLRYLRAAPETAITTPQAYLRRIATNLLRDRAERSSTRLSQMSVPLIEGLDKAADFDPHRELEGRQDIERWTRILERLKPRTLEVFLLSRVDGHTYEEIGSRLGISVWSVQRHMSKAIDHIAQNRKRER